MPEHPQPQKLVRYLHDCYRADNRELSIMNVFASKVEFRHFLTGRDELLSCALPKIPVAEPELREVQKKAALHRTEKDLLLAAIFLVGFVRDEGGIRRICAPLLLFPAEIEPGDEATEVPFVAADFAHRRIHYPAVSFLASLAEAEPGELDALVEEIPHAPLDIGKLGSLADRLEKTFPEVPAEELRFYPDPATEADLRKLQRATADELRLAWRFSSAVVLVRKSVETRGVLSELSRLADEERYSAPLSVLLGADGVRPVEAARRADQGPSRVPAILSRSQRRILEGAARNAVTLVIGPPGTGKSFTIAALALDALRRGESVLVASKMNHAVDVVADKIESILGFKSFVVRAGRKQYLRDLKDALQQILSGLLPVREATSKELIETRKRLDDFELRLAWHESRLEKRSEREQAWGAYAVDGPHETSWWRRRVARWKAAYIERLIANASPYWNLMSSYQRLIDAYVEECGNLLRQSIGYQLGRALLSNREAFLHFSKVLSARTLARREDLFAKADPEVLLEAFPIWMTNLADANSVVPLSRELFDLAILDEATQCDLASSLPVLQRAKRAVIVGDPHQLRHVSFLSRNRQRRSAERARLSGSAADTYDYREKSILDLANERILTQQQVALLDEHFRSVPPIIEFSNREFYRGRLKVMQERPGADFRGSLEYRFVGGRRDRSGANSEEAEAVVREVVALVEEEDRHPEGMRHTIGILSPFAAQVELLTKLIAPRLSAAQVEAHALAIGSPFAFQGEERDVMFLSLVVDPDSHPASFRFLNRPDVFNVSITRARSRQWICGSIDPRDPKVKGLLGRYLEHVEQTAAQPGAEDRQTRSRTAANDRFLDEVRAALESERFIVWTAYPVAGFRVELVVERDGRSLGIDLVGYPGEYSASFETERYRLWNRAGLRILPLPYSAWCRDRQECLRAIEEGVAST